ncbi:hypothetical protein [Streptomyces althioticus]|uniref:hypothetical protein n=1 Tax=Streptomyces althioticus TaxID=83380 RepID=UPI0033CC4835
MSDLDGVSDSLRCLSDLIESGTISLESHPGLPGVEDFRRLADLVDVLQERANLRKAREAVWSELNHLNPNFPMRVPMELRDRIKANAAMSGASLEGEAHRALEEYLAGRHEPSKPKRAPKGIPTANLNIRIDKDIRHRVEQRSLERFEGGESSWAPKTSHIIISWLVVRMKEGFRNPTTRGYRLDITQTKDPNLKETS